MALGSAHASGSAAQSKILRLQPNYFSFGEVYVGAIVEGSLRVSTEGKSTAGLSLKIKSPSFVRITDISKVQLTRDGKDVFCEIALSIDTQQVGNYSGPLQIQMGNHQVKVPVDVSILARKAGLTRVLIIETPFYKYSTSNASRFNAWLDMVKTAKLDVSYWLSPPGGQSSLRNKDLSKYDVVLLTEDGLYNLCRSDVEYLKQKQFVENGGRMIIVASSFFQGSVQKANELLIAYGLRMIDTEPSPQDEVDVGYTGIARDPLTKDVHNLYFHRPSPIAVTNLLKGKILVKAPMYFGKGFVAVSRAGKGEVVALGVSLWWLWIGEDAANFDNAKFFLNLLKKNSGGCRVR